MKKIIFILVLGLICFTSNSFAQTAPPSGISGWNGSTYPSKDTNTSVGTTVTTTKRFSIGGNKSLLAIQVDVTKISGTVAGWIDFKTSIDTGANYFPVASQALKDTAGTKSYYFYTNYNPGYYWSTSVNTTGTCSVSSTVWKLPRQ